MLLILVQNRKVDVGNMEGASLFISFLVVNVNWSDLDELGCHRTS